MELFSAEFFSALFAIVVIDLVLAGDNAIVIALAARNVPTELRTRAIVWGTVGAIAVRSAMTMVVVWLLNIPGLMLVGGLALIWIAVKLLTDKGDGAHNVTAAQSFWGAMRTIVVADAVIVPLRVRHQLGEALLIAFAEQVAGLLPAEHGAGRVAPGRALVGLVAGKEVEEHGRLAERPFLAATPTG